ncbi:MAG: hypothetical protein JWR60_3869 [Polaromonas sp.]|nr:hypothetical protein [Polaromonas sp.]
MVISISTNHAQRAMLTASERLVSFSTELKTILAGEDDELFLDDALFVLHQISGMAGALTMAVELEKKRELLDKPEAANESGQRLTKKLQMG